METSSKGKRNLCPDPLHRVPNKMSDYIPDTLKPHVQAWNNPERFSVMNCKYGRETWWRKKERRKKRGSEFIYFAIRLLLHYPTSAKISRKKKFNNLPDWTQRIHCSWQFRPDKSCSCFPARVWHCPLRSIGSLPSSGVQGFHWPRPCNSGLDSAPWLSWRRRRCPCYPRTTCVPDPCLRDKWFYSGVH